jgi:hypothetical protein
MSRQLARYLRRPSLRAQTLIESRLKAYGRPDHCPNFAELRELLETRADVHANDWRALYPELFETGGTEK